jgi:hypothetical protein
MRSVRDMKMICQRLSLGSGGGGTRVLLAPVS